MTVDPVLSLLVGALGAALLALLGAWIQSRREHAKWLRERRYEAHLAFLTLNDKHTTDAQMGQGPKTTLDMSIAIEGLNAVVSALSLLGPEYFLDPTRALRLAAASFIQKGEEPAGYSDIRAAYIRASRKALKIS